MILIDRLKIRIRIRKVLDDFAKTQSFNLDDLDKDEQEGFLVECSFLYRNRTLNKLIDSLANSSLDEAGRNCRSWDMVKFNRATLNGLYLLKEEVERFANIYYEKNPQKKKEDFDKHEVI